MTVTNLRELDTLVDQLEQFGVPRSPRFDAASRNYALLQEYGNRDVPIRNDLASLDAGALSEEFDRLLSRANTASVSAVQSRMQVQLTLEAVAALQEHVPTILGKLRPAFARAAKVVATATAAGIVPNMTAQDVINLDSPDALESWRSLPENLGTLQVIAAARIALSEWLDVAPSKNHWQLKWGEQVDYTACFTHPASGIISGYSRNAQTWNQWLSLSIATGGRLRLNDPDETERMLHGDGASPGWVLSAHSAIVYDDEGRALHLYREYGDWIPQWVEPEQVAHLVDAGVVVAAKPDAVRPADKRPLT